MASPVPPSTVSLAGLPRSEPSPEACSSVEPEVERFRLKAKWRLSCVNVLKLKTPTKVKLRLSFHEILVTHDKHLQSHTQSVDRILIFFPDGIIRNNLSLWGNSSRKYNSYRDVFLVILQPLSLKAV